MAKSSAPAKKESGIKRLWGRTRNYFVNVYSELKKVHWPNRRQLLVYTVIVLVMVALVALILWLFDTGISYLVSALLSLFK